ncbi:MAG: metallophosphoesterase family protein [Acidimicrobiia bacterium]
MVRVVVLSDTHIRRGSSRRLPDRAYDELLRADLVLHAGDVVERDLLDELEGFAPVRAVLGNNDLALVGVLPDQRLVDVEGVQVGVVHDAGPSAGRAARLRRRFPTADVVVFGHSHQPVVAPGLGGQLLVNPGSPTERRRAPTHTLAVLEVDGGRLVAADLVEL